MKKTILILTVLCLPSISQARCPADDMGCTSDNYEQKVNDRIKQGKKDVWNAKGVSGKAKAVGDTVRDCADCGAKVINDSLDGSSVTRE